MIVVDTNVISELMRGDPHPAVLSWVAAQPRPLLYTTYVSQAEIRHAWHWRAARGPAAHRPWPRLGDRHVRRGFRLPARILPFEARAAARYPEDRVGAPSLGR